MTHVVNRATNSVARFVQHGNTEAVILKMHLQRFPSKTQNAALQTNETHQQKHSKDENAIK